MHFAALNFFILYFTLHFISESFSGAKCNTTCLRPVLPVPFTENKDCFNAALQIIEKMLQTVAAAGMTNRRVK